MDAQLKKGILEICVLAELCRGPSYGYRIEKDLEEHVKMSESALYHILKRHEQAGLVRAESVEYNGRLRRMYEITEAGRGRLLEFKEEWREAAKAFSFIERAAMGHDQA
jgi:PadR family transcriptional regulator PadR